MSKSCKWFIEPIGAYTNGKIAENQDFLCEEQIFDGITCADGEPHKLWGCKNGFSDVSKFMKSRVFMGTFFKVWRQVGKGQIEVWLFSEKKMKKKLPVHKIVAGVAHIPTWAKDISTK